MLFFGGSKQAPKLPYLSGLKATSAAFHHSVLAEQSS
jgi:hypothetical protein